MIFLTDGGNLLIDCPPELRIQCARFGVYDIAATLITHTHADHIMGMDDLRSICMKTRAHMPVYTLPRYQRDIRRIFDYAFMEHPSTLAVPRFDLIDLPDEIVIGDLKIQTFLVDHGPSPVIGLRANGYVYITDVGHIPEPAWKFLEGVDVLVLDAVRLEPHPNHFHFDKAIEVALKIGARQTYLTHLGHDYDHDRTEANLPQGISLAFDGLRIPL